MSSKLIANFDIPLQAPLLLKRSEYDNLLYELKIDGFDVSLRLLTDRFAATKTSLERHWTVPYTAIELRVAKEDSHPPPIDRLQGGQINYESQRTYFEERLPLFSRVAKQTLRALIQYFKYRLWQPLLEEPSYYSDALNNPKWTNVDGEVIGKGTVIITVERIPGMRTELGTILFQKKHDKALIRALQSPVQPLLDEELLYDAQTSIWKSNQRRAVIELALAVEVMVKELFFSTGSTAGSVFEHLEDRGKVNVRVVDLISTTANAVYGESFKINHPDEYIELDYLFRARNKAAHRGQVLFRDDNGTVQIVDQDMLHKWWNVVWRLRTWTNILKKK